MCSSLTSDAKVDFADSKRRRLYVAAAAAFTGSCLPEIIHASRIGPSGRMGRPRRLKAPKL